MDQAVSEPAVTGHNAARHDDVCPAWSGDVLSWLLGSPAPKHRLEVLDLGAGTGLGTRTIAALGHKVTAVDTADDMLSVLIEASRKLPPEVARRIATATGSAERIPLKDRSVDAITCLQAWHWVDPVKAMIECDRVLRPHGVVGLRGIPGIAPASGSRRWRTLLSRMAPPLGEQRGDDPARFLPIAGAIEAFCSWMRGCINTTLIFRTLCYRV